MIRVKLSPEAVAFCRSRAEAASIGGVSRIRPQEERETHLRADQTVGMLGQAAFSKYWFGSFDPFKAARWVADMNPRSGDGGSDFLGMNVDIKTSMMRRSQNPLDYHLWIRDREWHSDTVYVLCLVPESLSREGPVEVCLVGWITGKDVTKRNGDRREAAASELLALPDVRWWQIA